jgi:hypothetical protein
VSYDRADVHRQRRESIIEHPACEHGSITSNAAVHPQRRERRPHERDDAADPNLDEPR